MHQDVFGQISSSFEFKSVRLLLMDFRIPSAQSLPLIAVDTRETVAKQAACEATNSLVFFSAWGISEDGVFFSALAVVVLAALPAALRGFFSGFSCFSASGVDAAETFPHGLGVGGAFMVAVNVIVAQPVETC
jgi:hypothetical protein